MNGFIRSSRTGFPAAAGSTILLIAVGTWLLGVGCNSSSTSAPKPGGSNDAASANCEKLLESAMTMLDPAHLGISSDRDRAIDTLNIWLSDCGSAISPPPAESAQKAALADLFSPEEIRRIEADGFLERDGSHIRNSWLFNRTLDFALADADNDLDRIVNLFYYVVRNVQLEEAHPSDLPLPPYQVLLLGRGTAEDRAVIFVNLLRQLQIDSVLLTPSDENASGDPRTLAGPWLIGVLLDDEVYLFDPRLGLPIPAPNETAKSVLVRQPATLAEATSRPAVFEQLDLNAEQPYPLRADDLKQPRVLLVGNSSLWAPRMTRLQAALIGEISMTVYDGLHGSSELPGLLTRVVESGAGMWQSDDIAVWSYPETQFEAHEQLDDTQRQQLDDVQATFNAPIPLTRINLEDLDLEYGSPRRLQLKTRTAQLLGDYTEAVREYQNIRLAELFPPSPPEPYIRPEMKPVLSVKLKPEVKRLHKIAAEDARYWLGICQYELGSLAIATKTLENYLEQYPDGRWTTASRYLLALIHLEENNPAQAADVLKAIPSESPQSKGFQLLVKRAEKPSSQD